MRTRLVSAVATAVLLAALALAQALPPGVQTGASVEGITEYTFSNGLRVLLFPDPSNPKITVNVTYLVGSRHEGYGETGMAHLLEHLLFIRTTNDREIKKELTSRGAQWNGSTSYDRTNYYETFTASDENLRWALGLEADRMVQCRMEKALLDPEMTVVRNEFERGENSAARVLQERVVATAYLWHNYGKSTIGSRADIENVPIDRLADFYRKYYQPDNAVLVVAGQIAEARALALVAETVGQVPRPARKLEATYTVEPAQDGERYVALRRVGEGQSLMVMYHTPAAAHPDSAPLEVLAGVMSGGGGFGGRGSGGGGTGRLYKALVDNKKAVSASMSARQLHDPGYAVATAQLSNEQSLPEARRILLDTVEGLIKEPPTREEVERVKARLARSAEMRMTDSQSLGLGLSEWAAMGDWRLLFLNRDRVKNVTVEDVVRVAKTYFVESNRTVGEFIPTANPVRAEVPATPNLAALFKDYKGGASMAHGEAFDPTPANVESRVARAALPGGLKLVMLPRQTRGGTVSVLLELHFGDEKSLAGKAAAAQFAGGLLMRGTRAKTRQQIQDEMDRLKSRIMVTGGGGGGDAGGRRRGGGGGGSMGGPADASASIETTKENLAGALRLALEMLREPRFDEADFDQVRTQRIAAIESGRGEPQTLAALELQRRLSPYPRGDVRYVGTLEEQLAEVRKVTLNDVRQFHGQFYGASHGELVVAGQFDPEELRKMAAEVLGGWASSTPYAPLVALYRKAEPANLKIETPDKQNATFEAGLRVRLPDDDADYPALLLANQMFGGSLGSLGSRMPNRIRNVEGLSYSVASRFSVAARGDAALFSAMAISNPQNAPKVEACFQEELARALKGGFTAEEVATAKKAFRDQQAVARSQEQGLVRTLASREGRGRTMQWDRQLEEKIQTLTPEQINAAFRRHIDPAALVIVKAGDFKKAGVY
jgi:zinc protease